MPQSTTDLTPDVAALQSQLREFDAANASICAYWPIAKGVLSMLQGMAGGYPAVQAAIAALIAAGNAVCPSSAATKAEVLEQMRQEGITSLDDMADYLLRAAAPVRGRDVQSSYVFNIIN